MSAESIEGTLLCLRAQEEGWNPLVALHYIYTVSKPYPALPCPSSRCDFSSLLLPSLTLCETSWLSFRPGLARLDPASGPLHKLSFLLETVFPRPCCPCLPCTVWVSVQRYLLRELSLTLCPSHHSLLVREREDRHTPPSSSRSPVALQVQRPRIQSLVRELRSHMPSGVAKNMVFFFF